MNIGGYMSGTAECEFPSVKIPRWISEMPKEIQPYIRQEYYVNPQQAELFADCKSYDDVRACRRGLSHIYRLPQSRELELDFEMERFLSEVER
ncbi:MAG: hypothetical protein LBV09_04415 [Deferribacteraceae bacterium]|jgi:hypothetical protein|nr:hypothetical protein [Deferribacteraceae bacterium]